jgi:hypothetical protein
MDGHRHVLLDRHFQNHAVTSPIFGHIRDAARDGILRRLEPDRLAVQSNLARISWRNAKQDTREFGAPGAHQPGEAENFSCAQIKRNAVHARFCASDIAQRQRDVLRCAFAWRINLGHFAPDHHADQRRFVDVAHAIRPDAFAVPQNRYAVRQREDLLEPV